MNNSTNDCFIEEIKYIIPISLLSLFFFLFNIYLVNIWFKYCFLLKKRKKKLRKLKLIREKKKKKYNTNIEFLSYKKRFNTSVPEWAFNQYIEQQIC